MFFSKNIVKYLLVFVFSQFLMVDVSFASPVPVFCMVNFIQCGNNLTPNKKSYILESDYASGKALKRYDLNSYYILESDYASGKALKRYD